MGPLETSFYAMVRIIFCGLLLLLSATPSQALDCYHRLQNETDDILAKRLVKGANLIFDGLLKKVEFLGRPEEGDFEYWILTYASDFVHKGSHKGYHRPPINIRILATYYCDDCEKLIAPRVLELPSWSLMNRELVLAGERREGLEKLFPFPVEHLKSIDGSIGDCIPSRFASPTWDFGQGLSEAMAIYKVLRQIKEPAK